jgi:hypothetical protein
MRVLGRWVYLAATVVLASAVRTGLTIWRVSNWPSGSMVPSARSSEPVFSIQVESQAVASGSKRYKIPWNRREARDETLDNRGNFGSRVVLKRDCAYLEEGNHARLRTATMYFSWYRIGQY